MRIHEVITTLDEGKMKEIAMLIDDVVTVGNAKANPSLSYNIILLDFERDDEKNRLILRPHGDDEKAISDFRKRIFSAAIAVRDGKRPRSLEDAAKAITGPIGRQAIRILTNTSFMSITKGKVQ